MVVRGPVRRGVTVAVTAVALVFVWAALVLPDQTVVFTVGEFVRLPLEIVVVIAVGAVLPTLPRRVLAVLAGVLLGMLVFVRVLDVGFITAFDRPFDPVSDSAYVGIGIETLRDGIGRASANIAVIAITALLIGLLLVPALALLRVTAAAAAHRHRALARRRRPRRRVGRAARRRGAGRVDRRLRARRPRGAVGAERAARARHPRPRDPPRPLPATPPNQLLTGLRGKDVLLLFVESYGQVAVQNSSFAPAVDRGPRPGHRAAQRRRVLRAQRLPVLLDLRGARAGWRTSPPNPGSGSAPNAATTNSPKATASPSPPPSNAPAGAPSAKTPPTNATGKKAPATTTTTRSTTAATSATKAPPSAYPPCPTNTSCTPSNNRELAKPHRRPVFAEIDLISSHAPWTKIPRLIPWNNIGDGSIYHHTPLQESTTAKLFGDDTRARTAYAHSIQYTMSTITSFIRRYATNNTVIVLLGDHQPATTVSGQHATHNVPISIIAHDPQRHPPNHQLALATRPPPHPHRPHLAHGNLPRPLPHRLRLHPHEWLTLAGRRMRERA